MKDLYKKILKSIPDQTGHQKIDAISGMGDVLRCNGFPEAGVPIFTRLTEYLSNEDDIKSFNEICDALYEGMLNEYDKEFDINILKNIVEEGSVWKACAIIDVLNASLEDLYKDIIREFTVHKNTRISLCAEEALKLYT